MAWQHHIAFTLSVWSRPQTARAVHFKPSPSVEELLRQQGKRPVDDLSVLLGGWPEDEPLEEFLVALREWRGHQTGGGNHRAA